MATQYTPEEIAEIFEAYNNAIKTGTPISAELATQMRDAAKGTKDYTAAQKALLASLGKSVGELGKAMYQGQQGMTAMNGAVDALGSGIEVIINLIPGARLLKMGLTLVTKAAVGAAKAIGEQTDALMKSYQDISKFGAGAADGMRGVFENMQKFGYGIGELDKMTSLLKENSQALASFGGTAAAGTKAFADVATQVQRTNLGKELQFLGKLPDDINKGMTLFIRQQQQSGLTNSQINQNLAQRSAEYIKNLDMLSKLTGEDAEKLQAKLDAAMEEDAFNQTIFELRKKAAAGDIEAGKLATEYENTAKRLTGDALKEFQQGVGGDISAMSKTLMTSGEAVSMIGSKAFTASGYIDALSRGAIQARSGFGELAKLNATRDFLLPMKEISMLESRNAEISAQQQEDLARAQQELQIKGLEPGTRAAVELRIAQMQVRDSFQSLVKVGVNPATEALSKLAKGASSVVEAVNPATVTTGQPMGGTPGQAQVDTANRRLLDIIGQGESRGNYNALVYGKSGAKVPGSIDLTNMTIAQVQEYQKGMIARGHASTAVGKYQMISSTLAEQVKKAGMDPNTTMFNAQTQDRLATQLIEQAGLGRKDVATVMRNLSGTWAALPKDMSGSGTYDGFNRNQASISPEALRAAILAGPTGGYDNKMSQLKPGETLPPQEKGGTTSQGTAGNSSDEMMSMLANQLANLDRRMSEVADNTKKSADYAAQ